MLNFMVNAEGGLTTAGYAICIVLGIVVFGIALFFAGKNSEKNKMLSLIHISTDVSVRLESFSRISTESVCPDWRELFVKE